MGKAPVTPNFWVSFNFNVSVSFPSVSRIFINVDGSGATVAGRVVFMVGGTTSNFCSSTSTTSPNL